MRQRRLSWSCFADFPRGVITVSATITAALIQLRFNGGGCSNCLFQDGGVVSRDQGCCVATATPRYDPTERHSSRDWRDRLMPTDREWPSSSFFPHLNHISSRFSRSLWELRFDLVSLQLPADALYVSLRSFSHPHRTFLFTN